MNYGFLSYYDVSPKIIEQSVDRMFDEVGIRDVQFYDFFDNYAGKNQDYGKDDPRGKAPFPEWWKAWSWTDPWDSQTKIHSGTVKAATSRVKLRGGKSWAYLQAVGSEHWDLGKPGSHQCGNGYNPGSAQAASATGTDGVMRLCNSSGLWTIQESPTRVFPAYFMNGALAEYQVAAWVDIVKELGFDGIHWDTLGVKAKDYAAESRGVNEFLRVAGKLLKQHGLLQTMNMVDTHWWDNSLFPDVLHFPYAEIWSPFHEGLFYQRIRGNSYSVIANYPGTEMNGCCCTTATDCHLCAKYGEKKYARCPNNYTQQELLEIRWVAAARKGARYAVVGNGLNRLVTEFFPWTIPLAPETLWVIGNTTVLPTAPAVCEDADNGLLSPIALREILLLVVVAFVLVCCLAACGLWRRATRRGRKERLPGPPEADERCVSSDDVKLAGSP